MDESQTTINERVVNEYYLKSRFKGGVERRTDCGKSVCYLDGLRRRNVLVIIEPRRTARFITEIYGVRQRRHKTNVVRKIQIRPRKRPNRARETRCASIIFIAN